MSTPAYARGAELARIKLGMAMEAKLEHDDEKTAGNSRYLSTPQAKLVSKSLTGKMPKPEKADSLKPVKVNTVVEKLKSKYKRV